MAQPTESKAKTLVTPVAPCQWAKVFTAEHNRFDPSKNPAFSIELLLDSANQEHMAFLMAVEDLWSEHCPGKRRHVHAFPFQPDKKNPAITVVRFKLPQFTRKDGTVSPGPRVVDALKRPWPPAALIGNNSKVQIAFDVYSWDSPSGSGLTFQPRVVMVVEHLEYQAGVSDEEALEALAPIPSAPTAQAPIEDMGAPLGSAAGERKQGELLDPDEDIPF